MSHLRPETGSAGLWRWICRKCGMASRRWFRSDVEAVEAARVQHSHQVHPEVHFYGHEPPPPPGFTWDPGIH